jgi:hypothetical protein
MQVLPVLLAVVGSTAWLALDASKRDWEGNSFARNVPSWVAGSLLLWPVIFPLYVFVHRKKAPLKNPPADELQPAAAMATTRPSEQHGPAIDEVEPKFEQIPEPVVEIEPAPVAEFAPEPDPVVEFETEPEPVIEIEREPVIEVRHEPIVEIEPEPDPVIELEAEPMADAPEERVVDSEPVIELQFHAGEEPVFDISRPAAAAPAPEPIAPPSSEQAPPGLSVDAFKDIKPVSFGGFSAASDEEAEAADVQPEPEPAVEPDPVVEVDPKPMTEPEPLDQPEPGPHPEPLADVHPEPLPDVQPAPPAEPFPDLEPIAYPALDAEPVIELEPEPIYAPEPIDEPEPTYEPERIYEPEPIYQPEPLGPDREQVAASIAADFAVEEAPSSKKKRSFNPEIKLPSFGRKKAKVAAASANEPKPKRGLKLSGPQLKLPRVTLPPSLQGPLNDLERKIALGSLVAVAAAAAFGYTTAPSDEEVASTPAPAPAATSR